MRQGATSTDDHASRSLGVGRHLIQERRVVLQECCPRSIPQFRLDSVVPSRSPTVEIGGCDIDLERSHGVRSTAELDRLAGRRHDPDVDKNAGRHDIEHLGPCAECEACRFHTCAPFLVLGRALELVVALILSAGVAQAFPWMPFASGATAALAKIEASLPHQRARKVQDLMMRIMIGTPSSASTRQRSTVSPLLARLFEVAFSEERLLSFAYQDRNGAATRRVVEPHGLLVRAPLWYVIAWDTAIDEPRLFRADRIRSPHVLARTFAPRPHELVCGICPDARPVRDTRHRATRPAALGRTSPHP